MNGYNGIVSKRGEVLDNRWLLGGLLWYLDDLDLTYTVLLKGEVVTDHEAYANYEIDAVDISDNSLHIRLKAWVWAARSQDFRPVTGPAGVRHMDLEG